MYLYQPSFRTLISSQSQGSKVSSARRLAKALLTPGSLLRVAVKELQGFRVLG